MRDLEKYRGVIPAFYACYDEDGEISAERTEALALHFLKKGVKGLYVNGSSGECIYQSVEDRKKVLEHVMKAVGGKLTIIAHVACNNWVWTLLQPFRRSISICRIMRLPITGMTSVRQLPIRIS